MSKSILDMTRAEYNENLKQAGHDQMLILPCMDAGAILYHSRLLPEGERIWVTKTWLFLPNGEEYELIDEAFNRLSYLLKCVEVVSGKGLLMGVTTEYALNEKGAKIAAWATPDSDWIGIIHDVPPDEQKRRALGRDRSAAALIIKSMTRNDDARLRGDKMLFKRGVRLEESHYNRVLTCLTEGAIARVMPKMEAFIDVDGLESFRLSESGIAAIEKRKKKTAA